MQYSYASLLEVVDRLYSTEVNKSMYAGTFSKLLVMPSTKLQSPSSVCWTN